jgi:hypothetical protein
MSLHQKLTMSKSHPTEKADNNGAPIFTGGPVVRQMLATVAIEPGKTRQRRVGERASRPASGFGQRLFAILFQRSSKIHENQLDRCSRRGEILGLLWHFHNLRLESLGKGKPRVRYEVR